MPFGLKNAPSTFMDVIHRVFQPCLDQFIVVFINDILIHSKPKEAHDGHLRIVLHVLRDLQLYAKFSKCEFWLTELKFLGHVASASGVSMDPKKVEAVMRWERPKSVFEIHSFLDWQGITGGLLRTSPRLADSMTRLTWKKVKFEWNDLCERAF